ncbi:MAG: PP2C family protein-serine/threonine phosphatase [Deltaproteobacteria bacterium]|nr:PP2C family protein-serine/threonine phosphatase [Deltaproteobacteria bacterium]
MSSSIKSFINSLNEVPEGKFPPQYYTPLFVRSIVFGNYSYPSGLLSHFLFLVIFALIGVTILAIFNILSILLFAIAFILHRKGYLWQAFYLISLEIIAHAAIAIAVIGWGAGFQYYILLGPAVIFLLPGKTIKKILLAGIYTFSFAALNYYANVSTPTRELSAFYIALFNYGNIFSVCSILSYLVYQYYRAANSAEKKLEKEHQKTNAALNERNQALERLNQELSEAADYVKTILPQPVTEGAIRTDWRFVPSTSLGGDAFGYHWVDEEHFAIYLIDVSGHGVGAALLSVSVMNVLRSQSLPDTDFKAPEQVLEALNLAFPSEDNNDMFFTMWYGIYNRRTDKLTYASGGHPPALLLGDTSTGESKITPLRTPNNVIGGMSHTTYEKRGCTIGERNTLYIFSDGVYEVEKSDGSMWRFQEFSDFMTQRTSGDQSRLDHLYRHAKSLGNLENLEDDFTILEVAFA